MAILIKIDVNGGNFFCRIIAAVKAMDSTRIIWPNEIQMWANSIKAMATIFWDSEGFVLVDFLKRRNTVTEAYYIEALKKIRSGIS